MCIFAFGCKSVCTVINVACMGTLIKMVTLQPLPHLPLPPFHNFTFSRPRNWPLIYPTGMLLLFQKSYFISLSKRSCPFSPRAHTFTRQPIGTRQLMGLFGRCYKLITFVLCPAAEAVQKQKYSSPEMPRNWSIWRICSCTATLAGCGFEYLHNDITFTVNNSRELFPF